MRRPTPGRILVTRAGIALTVVALALVACGGNSSSVVPVTGNLKGSTIWRLDPSRLRP